MLGSVATTAKCITLRPLVGAYSLDQHAITIIALYTRSRLSPAAGARLRLKELPMPDLDLIKQGEQGLGVRRRRFARGGRALRYAGTRRPPARRSPASRTSNPSAQLYPWFQDIIRFFS